MTIHLPRDQAARVLAAASLAVVLLSSCTSQPNTQNSTSSLSTAGSESPSIGSTPSTTGYLPPIGGDETSGVSIPESIEGSTSADQPPAIDLPEPATTPVSVPNGGNVDQTVATSDPSINPSVGLNQPGEYGNGVTVTLSSIEAIQTTAELPGEVSGAGLSITVSFENSSANEIDLNNVVVDLQDSAGTPANAMSASPASPFSGVLPAGQSASGVYVFALPGGYTGPASIRVSYSTEVPVVLFVGDAQ